MSKYKVGTRDSLLAVTQTQQIIDELETLTAHQFEMVTMKTSGDLDTSKPLWQMDGKNFFTRELDFALMDGTIDLMVSSYKDIGGERPNGIVPAAVTKRHFSNDILLIKKETVQKLSEMDQFIVGTSSPRRITNITTDLSKYLPSRDNLSIECKNLRGNVNTRIEKLRRGEYDAIILALAGLERLARSTDSHRIIKELLNGLTFMVLPEKIFPSAPAQGSLLLECLEGNEDLRSILKVVHHEETATELEVERKHFRSFGGGCHLAVGIYAKSIAGGHLTVLKGEHNGETIDSVLFKHPLNPQPKGEIAFLGYPLGREQDPHFIGDAIHVKDVFAADLSGKNHLFLTSPYGLQSFIDNQYEGVLWVSGDSTFKKAVAKGLWVNGSADSLGESEISRLKNSEALKLMGTDREVFVLTSSRADSNIGDTIPCYNKSSQAFDENYRAMINGVETFYWTSYPQFEEFSKHFPEIKHPSKIHCTGMGKTYTEFIKAGIDAVPFADVTSFKIWFLNKGVNS